MSDVSADVFDVTGQEGSEAIVLRVMAHPGAGRASVVGIHGDALKVRVSAPPVGGRANQAVVEMVAELFGVKETAVKVVAGETSRNKRLEIAGISPDDAHRLIDEALARAGVKASSGRRGGSGQLPRRA